MKFNFTKVDNSNGNENCVIVSKKYKEYNFIRINDIYFNLRHFTKIADFNICITSFIETMFDLESVKIEFFKKLDLSKKIHVTYESKYPKEIISKCLSKYILCNNKQFRLMFLHNNSYIHENITIKTDGVGLINEDTNIEQSVQLKANNSLSGVGGMSQKMIDFVREVSVTRNADPELIKKLNIKHTKGVILYGPPGTGKTLIARKMGELLNATSFKVISGPEIFDKYVGSSEENIRLLFEEAEKDKNPKSLHIIVFDEIDSIFRARGGGSHAVYDNVVNQVLSKMDGVHQLNNILLFGTTNMKEQLDPALLRAGRFEAHIEIGLPDINSRKEIYEIYLDELKNLQGKQKIDSGYLAQISESFSGAEISSVINKVKRQAITNQSFTITQDDIKKEILSRNKNIFVYLQDYKNYLSENTTNDVYSVSETPDYFDIACNIAYSISKDKSLAIHKIICFENILTPQKIFAEFQNILKILNTSTVSNIILLPDFHILLNQIDKFMLNAILNKKYSQKNIFVFGFDLNTSFNSYLKYAD